MLTFSLRLSFSKKNNTDLPDKNSGLCDDRGPRGDRPRRRKEHRGVVGVEAGGGGPSGGARERSRRSEKLRVFVSFSFFFFRASHFSKKKKTVLL